MRTRVLLIATAALFTCTVQTACMRGGDSVQVASVDSLMRTTDSLMNALNSLDVAALQHFDSLYATQREAVMARMRDTLSKENAIALGNYHRAMSSSLGRALKDRAGVMNELETSKDQLADLQHDLEKGILETAMAATYISQERLHLQQAARACDIVSANAATVFRDHEKYHAKVDSLIGQTLHTTAP